MARVYTIVNQKGGVGKTTTTINLGAYLAYFGQRVLLVDIDPQSNTTSCLGIDKHNVKLRQFPDEMLTNLKKLSEEVLEEEAKKDKMSTKVNNAFKALKKQIGPWGMVSEKAYYDLIFGTYALKKG